MNAFTFSATLDSKGRITVPSRIRKRLNLGKGDEISLSLSSTQVVVEEVGSYREALEFINSLDSVKSFSYEDGVVEVTISDR